MLVPVPDEVARTASLALETRAERGGGTARGVVIATALSTGHVRPAELGELRRWHARNPDAVQNGSSTLLAGLYGGSAARAWTAAAMNPAGKGAMIALPVPAEVAGQIARSDGEPADEMHVTLFHFGGDASALDAGLRDQLDAILSAFTHPAPRIDLSHVERFTAGEEGLEPVVLVDDGPEPYELRQALQDRLDAAEIPYSNDHAFRVHTTIGYYADGEGPDAGPVDEPYQWTPDAIMLHWGDDVTAYPFPGAAPVTAAASSPMHARLAKMSKALNRTDRQLMLRLHTAATVAFNEALRQAGVKVIGKARNQQARAAAVAAVQGGNPLGPMLAAMGVTEQDFIDKRFATFEAYALGVISAAERKKLIAAARALGLDPDEVEHEYSDTIDARAAAAAGLMVASLGLLARSALSGHTVTPESVQGEFSGPVPFSIVRKAVTVASRGASVPLVDDSGPGPSAIGELEGKLTEIGQTLVDDLLDTVGVRVQLRSTWRTGDPARPFDKHELLEGETWVDTQPDALAADPGEFPYVDVYEPGDHDGCQCVIESDYEPYDGDGEPAGVAASGDTRA